MESYSTLSHSGTTRFTSFEQNTKGKKRTKKKNKKTTHICGSRTHTCKHTHMHAHARTQEHAHTHTHTHRHTHIGTHIEAHTHRQTDRHIHTQTPHMRTAAHPSQPCTEWRGGGGGGSREDTAGTRMDKGAGQTDLLKKVRQWKLSCRQV